MGRINYTDLVVALCGDSVSLEEPDIPRQVRMNVQFYVLQ